MPLFEISVSLPPSQWLGGSRFQFNTRRVDIRWRQIAYRCLYGIGGRRRAILTTSAVLLTTNVSLPVPPMSVAMPELQRVCRHRYLR